MKVLLPAAEVAPIIKLGGLGDVIGSLPKALEKLGVNIDVIVPYYPFAKTENIEVYKVMELMVPFDDKSNLVEVHKTKLPGSDVDVILLRNSDYFANYGKGENGEKISETELFSFFDRAVVEYIKSQFNTYDLVHCNDWHTGLITHLLQDELAETRPATLFTVHNLMYQGIGNAELVREMGMLPGSHPLIDWDISDGDLNFMQQGVSSSDYINAVSPTYAKEILTEEFGGVLSEVLKAREGRLSGILNGIDYSSFPRDFDETNWEEAKKKLKKELIDEVGLEKDYDKPLFSYIGRLDPNQKGLDILFDILPKIAEKGGQFVLLGTGDKIWEGKLAELDKDKKYGKNLSMKIMFDVDLATKIYSGSDFLMVPSKYEPCGLIQMIAMWYGTLPIVRSTGGLKDSVKHRRTGFIFDDYSADSFFEAVAEAFTVYNGHEFHDMVDRAIREDLSWNKSAEEYKKLYEYVINLRLDAVGITKEEL